jgi:glycine oxidase
MNQARGADVAIIGDGVIGLSTALELAAAGATCCIIGASQPGAASSAAAGLLAPAVGHLEPKVRPFFVGSLDLYPEFLDPLRAFDPSLSLLRGLIEILGENPERSAGVPSKTLSPDDVRTLEPSVSAPRGALLHIRDAAIDNVRLVAALRRAIARQQRVRLVTVGPADAVGAPGGIAAVFLRNGERIEARRVVIAAGAWSAQLRGLPRPLPVSPLKGQMLALSSTVLHHPVMGDDVYLVPREGEIVVGATTEQAGFDVSTTPSAIGGLRAAAANLCPALAAAQLIREWAGSRPATPDMLPILGPDPDAPWLLYACGHSKNGILLAPATARVMASLSQDKPPEWDLEPFSIMRFDSSRRSNLHNPI